MAKNQRKIFLTCPKCNGTGVALYPVISQSSEGVSSKLYDEERQCDNCLGEKTVEFGYIQFKPNDFVNE